MKKFSRIFLALVLSLSLLTGSIGIPVFAEEGGTEVPELVTAPEGELPEDAPEEALNGASAGSAQETPEGTPEDTLNGAPAGSAQETPGETPEKTLSGVSAGSAQETPEETPDGQQNEETDVEYTDGALNAAAGLSTSVPEREYYPINHTQPLN